MLAAPLRVDEVIGQRARVVLGEPEAPQRRHNVSFTHFHGILTNAGRLFRRGHVLVLVQRGSRSEAPGSAGSGGRLWRLSPFQERTGRDLTMPTPCSRLVALTASAISMIARAGSAPGSLSTSGSPASPA